MESPELRRRTMQAVKSKDTAPELTVRRSAHSMGYRFRLHRKDLPGQPDLVFPGRHRIIFVHGCFWHGHDCARGARVPKGNREYWVKKIERNRERDRDARDALIDSRWRVALLWECELKNLKQLRRRLSHFLGSPKGIL
jgi:DNA mismatch endonuclease (patch repair protein)